MQVKLLQPHFDKILANAKWNFDLQDIDHILRIDSEENIVAVIMDLLHRHQYNCEELE